MSKVPNLRFASENANSAKFNCKPTHPCPQLKGTLLRIFIPAGAVINLLGLLEITSPSGICLIIRLPFLDGKKKIYDSIVSALEAAGGTVEVVDE